MGRKRVYVGGLHRDTRERDLEHFFKGFGRLEGIILKNEFAFVEFESSRDAEDAIYEMDGKKILGNRVSVTVARGKPRGRDRYITRRNEDAHRSRVGQRPIRTEHRLIVNNLSSGVSWQDLKDYMRQAGEVTYGEAHKEHRNVGVVEFASRSDLKDAIKLLDDTELNGRRIRLQEDKQAKRDRSLSSGLRSHSRSRSRSRYKTSDYSARHYVRSNRSSTGGSSKTRSRSGSVRRCSIRKRQNISRSASRSSGSSEGSRTNSTKRSCSRSYLGSPSKHIELVRGLHAPQPDDVPTYAIQPAQVQEFMEETSNGLRYNRV